MDKKVKKLKGQAERFIVDVSKGQVSKEVLDKQISKIFSSKETAFVEEVIIVSDGEIQGVFVKA